jgi:hypothetical protein
MPSYSLSDDVLTEGRHNTAYRETEGNHHSLPTNGLQGLILPRRVAQSSVEVKNAWMDPFTRLYAFGTWRTIYLLFTLCIPVRNILHY